jgi:predicted DCC family thiol-disulfide oxidoreductase YuxK
MFPAFFYLQILAMQNQVILFDGLCNLCSSVVQFVIKRDKKGLFKFASLQSAFGQSLLQQQQLSSTAFHSFVLYTNGKIYTKSTGALRVARHLSAPWPVLYLFLIIPVFIRNGVYDFIAKNRYRWFGKKAACWVPTPELKIKFLE